MHRQRRASIDLVHRFIGAEEDDAAAAKPSAPSSQALPTAWGDSAPPSKSAAAPADDPPVVLGRMRIALGLLLFYVNVYTDFLVLSVFRESEPLPVGEPKSSSNRSAKSAKSVKPPPWGPAGRLAQEFSK